MYKRDIRNGILGGKNPLRKFLDMRKREVRWYCYDAIEKKNYIWKGFSTVFEENVDVIHQESKDRESKEKLLLYFRRENPDEREKMLYVEEVLEREYWFILDEKYVAILITI